MPHLRPGKWNVRRGGTRISDFEQYQHLAHIESIARRDPELASAIGMDYIVKPDIVIFRLPEDDAAINGPSSMVGVGEPSRAIMRRANNEKPLLHASISCKWTLRSDRAQNSRAEALNLIRARKGRSPHIVMVTAEPLPSRLASIALGTGDLDVVYHFALPELLASAAELALVKPGAKRCVTELGTMVDGKRLRDIADLPLDLAV